MKLKEIQQKIKESAQKINVSEEYLPHFGEGRYDCIPYINIDEYGTMYWQVYERGQEIERKTTQDLDELLYWTFQDITFSLAVEYELKHRQEDKDHRRMIFAKQEELLAILNKNWAEKKQNEHQNILKIHPFDDLAGLRAKFYREMREKGVSEDKIEQIVYQKYPNT